MSKILIGISLCVLTLASCTKTSAPMAPWATTVEEATSTVSEGVPTAEVQDMIATPAADSGSESIVTSVSGGVSESMTGADVLQRQSQGTVAPVSTSGTVSR